MSTIESDAQPILSPMIARDDPVELDAIGQRKLASWIALRALLLTQINVPPIPPERAWLDEFYIRHVPPDTCYQWIAQYRGSTGFRYRGDNISVIGDDPAYRGPRVPDTLNGILMTLGLGYFAATVFWVEAGALAGPEPHGLLPIWPARSNSVSWPFGVFDDDGLYNINRLFAAS